MMRTTFNTVGAPAKVAGKRHFGKCKPCKTAWVSESTNVIQAGEYVQRFLGKQGWSDGSRWAGRKTLQMLLASPNCPNCGMHGRFKALEATMKESVPCDARCTDARGHKCVCSCGGTNHGSAA